MCVYTYINIYREIKGRYGRKGDLSSDNGGESGGSKAKGIVDVDKISDVIGYVDPVRGKSAGESVTNGSASIRR